MRRGNSLRLLVARVFVSWHLETHKFPVRLLAAQETAALWRAREHNPGRAAGSSLDLRSARSSFLPPDAAARSGVAGGGTMAGTESTGEACFSRLLYLVSWSGSAESSEGPTAGGTRGEPHPQHGASTESRDFPPGC